MRIEIWSDIVCPFCYIGKRNLEAALRDFPGKEEVTVEWRSFMLDPELISTGQDVYSYLAERKGVSLEESKAMHDQVARMAASSGLEYRFDLAKVANSSDAHQFIQMAKSKGLGDAAEEALFRSYFTEGRNISDHDVLATLADSIGLDRAEALASIKAHSWTEEVEADIREAARIGIRGVPFFVFDRKFAVSGAQPVDVFRKALERMANPDV